MSSSTNSEVLPDEMTSKIGSDKTGANSNDNETPSHHSSKENVQVTRAKNGNRPPVTSRLYQNTAASAARASKPGPGSAAPTIRNTTPVLGRKVYKDNVTPNKPPTLNLGRPNFPGPKGSEIKSQAGQKPVLSQNKSGVNRNCSSSHNDSAAKCRVATSSFINHEKVSAPADWDASVIVPLEGRANEATTSLEGNVLPTGANLREEPKKLLKGFLNFELRKTSKAKNQSLENVPRGGGPLRALLPTAQKSRLDLSEKTMFRSFETPKIRTKLPNNFSEGDFANEATTEEEMERLYDDYLMSELIRSNAEKSLRENSAMIDAEVKWVWLGVEELRCKALEQEELNRKLKTLLKLLKDIDGDIAIFQPFMESKIFSDKNFNELSNSLERSRHHLQVIGEHVNLDSSTVKKLQKKLENNTLKINSSTHGVETEYMQKLEETLSDFCREFVECKASAEKVRNLSLECSSLLLSEHQLMRKSADNLDSILDLLKLPPKPEIDLVDI